MDVEDITGGADWRARIKRGIEACKAYIFVLTPASLRSRHCREELELAAAQNKLVIPVYQQEVDEAGLPPVLADREWIFLRPDDDFDAGLGSLVEALETDLEWRDQHTRIAGRAREWLDAGHDNSFLLRGSDLRDAESWLARQAHHHEAATAEQAEYIVQSRRAASTRQRRLTAAVASALIVTAALALFALIQRNEAIDQRDTALSTLLATRALGQLRDDPSSSLALAMEAFATKDTDLAEGALRVSASQAVPHLVLRAHNGSVASVAYSPDRRHLATAGSDRSIRVWDARAPARAPVVLRGHEGPVASVAWAPDGRHLASTGTDRTVRLWDWRNPGTPPTVLRAHTDETFGLTFVPDGRHLASAGDDGTIRVWDWREPRVPSTVPSGATGLDGTIVTAAPNGRHLATVDVSGRVRVLECQRCGTIEQVLALARARLPRMVGPGG